LKRYISFDFIKGVGILGVVCFHVLNVAFSDEVDKIIAGDAHILLLLLGVVLLYLGLQLATQFQLEDSGIRISK